MSWELQWHRGRTLDDPSGERVPTRTLDLPGQLAPTTSSDRQGGIAYIGRSTEWRTDVSRHLDKIRRAGFAVAVAATGLVGRTHER